MSQKSSNLGNCISCLQIFGRDSVKVTCPTGQSLCRDCFKFYCVSTFAEPNSSNIPLCCPQCKQPYNQERVFMMLQEQQKLKYLSLQLLFCQQKLKPGQKFINCMDCPNGVIMDIDADTFFCNHQDCQSSMCLICMKRWTYKPQDEQNQDFTERQFTSDDPQWHFFCQEFTPLIKKLKRAYEQSITSRCPNCQVTGVKDQNCTHIECGNCQAYWCYICQKDIKGVLNHNHNWNQDLTSCPMYMEDVIQHDESLDQQINIMQLYHKGKMVHYFKQIIMETKPAIIEQLHRRMPELFFGLIPQQIPYIKTYPAFQSRYRPFK